MADTAATQNASIAVYAALSTSDSSGQYDGDTTTPSIYLASLYAQMDATRTKIPFAQWSTGIRDSDKLYLPLGSSTKTLTLTLVNPDDGTTSTQVITGATGDYVIDASVLNQPIIQRIQITT